MEMCLGKAFLCVLCFSVDLAVALGESSSRRYDPNTMDVRPGSVDSTWSRDIEALHQAYNTPRLLMDNEGLTYRPPINQPSTNEYRHVVTEQHFLPRPNIQTQIISDQQNRPNNNAEFMPLMSSPEQHFIQRPLSPSFPQQINQQHVGTRPSVPGQHLVMAPPPDELGPRPYLLTQPNLVSQHSLGTAPHVDTPGISIVANNVFIGRPNYPQMIDRPALRGGGFGQRAIFSTRQDAISMLKSLKGRPMGLLMMKLLTMAEGKPDRTAVGNKLEFQSRPVTDISQPTAIHHHHMDPRPAPAVNSLKDPPRTNEAVNYHPMDPSLAGIDPPRTSTAVQHQPGMANPGTMQVLPFSPLLSQQDSIED